MKNNDYEINIYKDLIHIKNYNKIKDINIKYIVIELNIKIIKINGNNLIINKLDEHELSIIGEFKGIELIDE
ncbi:MAG: YabP/YqfC family sporulation protein [bacterium]|nr:YabP/YqfC family sporulation protein [bacterium]